MITSKVMSILSRPFHGGTHGFREYGFYNCCRVNTKTIRWAGWQNNFFLRLPEHQQRFIHLKASSLPAIPERHNEASVSVNDNTSDEIAEKISSFENSSPVLLLEYVETIDAKMFSSRSIDVTSKLLYQLSIDDGYKVRSGYLSSNGLHKFCKSVRSSSRILDSSTLVNICKLFHHLEMPLSDVTFQIVLRLLSRHANTMEISQIIYLNFIIDKIVSSSSSPLLEALQVVLSRAFDNQLNLQISNNSSISELCNYLQFAVKTNCSEQCTLSIVRIILNKQMRFTPWYACRILCSLADSNFQNEEVKQLLQSVFEILSKNIKTIKVHFLNIMLRKCAKQVRLGCTDFYNETFVDAVVKEILVSGDAGSILRCTKPLSAMKHISVDFLESVTEIVTSDSSLLLRNDSLFFSFVRVLSHANYKPRKWMELQELFLSHPAIHEAVGMRLIGMTLDFMVLDILHVPFLKRVFSPGNKDALEVWFQKNGSHSLFILFNAMKHLYKVKDVPFPSDAIFEVWQEATKNKISHYKYPLKSVLHFALGGEPYVITGLIHNGIHIDHCVLMNEDGIPLMFDEHTSLNLDSFVVPDNCTLFLIKVVALTAQQAQTKEGIQSLETRILKTYGHPVVEIDAFAWQELLDSEKIPYVLQKLVGSK